MILTTAQLNELIGFFNGEATPAEGQPLTSEDSSKDKEKEKTDETENSRPEITSSRAKNKGKEKAFDNAILNEKYKRVIGFLEKVLAQFKTLTFNSHSGKNTEKEHEEEFSYEKIKRLLSQLQACQMQAPFELNRAFQEVYAAHCSHQSPSTPQESISLSQLSDALFKMFSGGIHTRLANRVEELPKYGCDTNNNLHSIEESIIENNIPQLISKCLEMISRFQDEIYEDKYSSLREKDEPEIKEKRANFLNELRKTVNEALPLLTPEQTEHLLGDFTHSKIDRLFSQFIHHKISLLNETYSLKIKATYNRMELDYLSIMQKYIDELLNTQAEATLAAAQKESDPIRAEIKKQTDAEREQKIIALRAMVNEIWGYQTGGIPTEFEIMNVRFLGRNYNPSPVMTAFHDYAIQRFNKVFLASMDLEDIFDTYTQTRNDFIGRTLDFVREPWSGGIASNVDSKASRLGDVRQFKAAISHLRSQNLALPDAKSGKPSSLQHFIGLARACNQGVFGPHTEKESNPTLPYSNAPKKLVDKKSQYKSMMGIVIERLRETANTTAPFLRAMLRNTPDISSEDLYFELNLFRNHAIKEAAEKKYNESVTGWARKTFAWATFNDSGIRNNRVNTMDALMKKLTSSKTAKDYVEFFQKARQAWSLSKKDGNHIWDTLYKEAIQTACRSVIEQHFLPLDQEFSLTITASQLLQVQKELSLMGMENDPSYTLLTTRITMLQVEESKRLNAALDEQVVTAPKSETSFATQKIRAFVKRLTSKLRGNVLADLIIDTGRVAINQQAVGNISGVAGKLIGAVPLPGMEVAGKTLSTLGNQLDTYLQMQEAHAITENVAEADGFLVWFEIADKAVNKLATMFKKHLRHMASQTDAENFADFCFERMYAASKSPNEDLVNLRAQVKPNGPLEPEDYLVAAVFKMNKSARSFFGWGDRYRVEGDTAFFAAQTFQQLVDDAPIICYEKPTLNSTQEPSTNPQTTLHVARDTVFEVTGEAEQQTSVFTKQRPLLTNSPFLAEQLRAVRVEQKEDGTVYCGTINIAEQTSQEASVARNGLFKSLQVAPRKVTQGELVNHYLEKGKRAAR